MLTKKIIKEILVEDSQNYSNLSSSKKYRVISPFDIFIIIDHKKTNAFYGSANIFEPVFQKYTTNIGDIIFNFFVVFVSI